MLVRDPQYTDWIGPVSGDTLYVTFFAKPVVDRTNIRKPLLIQKK